MGGNIQIVGNGNSAVVINGVSYNISRLFNTAVDAIMQKYRSELILMQFTSVSLVVILVLLLLRFLMPRSIVDKRLCVSIFKLKNGDPRQYSETWQSITCALHGLCCYTTVSPTLCVAGVEAEIIPVFVSTLSQTSYLEDLNTNSVTGHYNEIISFYTFFLPLVYYVFISNGLENIS
ncbi:unnamed protein product [Rotaria socialis]|uniref:Uncharacterized protein n=1 Tax=Rotaria socialis TaxID=392032 RepID=A0A820ZYX1_9BILA|nr:unnamed protein product [Rotaria socialis]